MKRARHFVPVLVNMLVYVLVLVLAPACGKEIIKTTKYVYVDAGADAGVDAGSGADAGADAGVADAGPESPKVIGTSPPDGGLMARLDSTVTITFDHKMDPYLPDLDPFRLTSPDGGAVDGGFTYDGVSTATFTPSAILARNTSYSGRVTTNALNIHGVRMAADYGWSFATTWTVQLATTGDDQNYGAASYSIDSNGNHFIAGHTTSAFPGNTNLGGYDHFLAKLDGTGSLVWVRQGATAANEYGKAVAVDPSGNVLFGGETEGNLTGFSSAGGRDVIVIKFDTDGNTLWQAQLGGSGDDVVAGIAVNDAGEVFLGGYAASGYDSLSTSSADCFVSKIDANGNRIWSRVIGSSGNDYCRALAIDNAGNVFVTGYSNGDFDGRGANGYDDIVVAKLDADGGERWRTQMGSDTYEYANAIAVDEQSSVYLSGYASSGFDGVWGVGGYDAMLMKLNPDGGRVWTRLYGSTAGDFGYGVRVLPSGDIVTVGSTWGFFDAGTLGGGTDMFVARFDSSGAIKWIRQNGSDKYDTAYACGVDATGDVVAVGVTKGGIDGQAHVGSFSNYDVFLVKYSSAGEKR